jgi:hypothetical protein
MAQVAQEIRTKAWIDSDLTYLLREWQEIPEVVRQWNDWDELDRLTFVVEWPLRAERMERLEYWDGQNELTTDQRERYRELRTLIARYRSDLEQLLAE